MGTEKSKSPLSGYGRYSGVAIQMAAIVALSAIGGVKLDQWLDLSPLFTIICSLAGVALAMYVVIKEFASPKQKDKKTK
ncbi:MAG: AtpZ/AtpI family protein [Bacteroidales bacterium]|nr:AtpZ/AtpI family protein [Bacteroidales bacterium]